VRTKRIDDTPKGFKQMLRDSCFVQDQASRAPLEDKKGSGYLDLEVSGDEESDVEDINSDSEGGEAVEAVKEG